MCFRSTRVYTRWIYYNQRMAGGRQDILGGQAVTSHGDGGLVQAFAMPQRLCKQTLADWKDATADYVQTKIFDKKQFVSDDKLVMGSNSGEERQRLSGRSKEG
jgi:hypothetical protein